MVPADSRRIPRVLRYSGAASLRLDGFGYGAVTLSGRISQYRSANVLINYYRRSYNPAWCIATPAVWALPLSLATTRGIIIIFSSCGYLDVSVPHVRSALCAVTESLPPGFPIRTSAGRRVFAPYRRFSQLVTSFFASESHRHPPCALICFPFSFRLFNRSSSFRLFLCRSAY